MSQRLVSSFLLALALAPIGAGLAAAQGAGSMAGGSIAWRTTVRRAPTPAPQRVAPPPGVLISLERRAGRAEQVAIARRGLFGDGATGPYFGAGVGYGGDLDAPDFDGGADADARRRFSDSRRRVDPMLVGGVRGRASDGVEAFGEYQLVRPMGDREGGDPAAEHRIRVGVRRRF